MIQEAPCCPVGLSSCSTDIALGQRKDAADCSPAAADVSGLILGKHSAGIRLTWQDVMFTGRTSRV